MISLSNLSSPLNSTGATGGGSFLPLPEADCVLLLPLEAAGAFSPLGPLEAAMELTPPLPPLHVLTMPLTCYH